MTDPQLIEAVLKACGWIHNEANSSRWHKGNIEVFASSLLTSLDACHEVFEKDATDEYWLCVAFDLGYEDKFSFEHIIWIQVAKATPRQRCEAFLNWKGIEV